MNPVISVQNLTRKFGDFVAVDHINFEVGAGEVVGYLGPNGCGKTTTIRMLLGLLALLGLGGAGLWQLLSHDDEARVYGELGRKINGIRQLFFDGFWECALDGEGIDARSVRNNTELTHWLRTLSDDADAKDYAAHLRDDCASTLEPIAPELDQLIVPADLKADVSRLQRAATHLKQSVDDWISCL